MTAEPLPTFDPVADVARSELILDDGAWPNFHDAEVHELHLWRGDVRPEAGVWIGPRLDVAFELCALRRPFVAVLRFHDCDALALREFNQQNALHDLAFAHEARGHLRDGRPLPPWILVTFEQAFGMRLSLRCMRIEVLERRAPGARPA